MSREHDTELSRAAADRDWKTYFRLIRERAAQTAKVALVAPEPEHTSRDPRPEDFAMPGVAARLVRKAEVAGWSTRTQYARAGVVCKRKVNGSFVTVLERRHSVAVRLYHEGRKMHAVAVWESRADAGKLSWSSVMAKLWEDGQLPTEVGVEVLTGVLE